MTEHKKNEEKDLTKWERVIKEACQEAGTYQPFFDLIIKELAGIMDTKDAALEIYEKSGGSPVVKYTNKGGFTNLRKNPALAVIQECNQQALAFWRDLGLTPSGFKKLDGMVNKQTEKDAFSELLGGII